MISETTTCKLCGKKIEAKGNIEVNFEYDLDGNLKEIW